MQLEETMNGNALCKQTMVGALSLRKDEFVYDRAFVANAHSPFFTVSSIEVPWSYPFVSPFCT
jgi:hypothetical protein